MPLVSSLADVAARAELARAEAARHPMTYRLGRGGFKPEADHPWNSDRECDCSGFTAFCMGLPRHYRGMPGDGEWIETSAIYRDATGAQEVFRKVCRAAPGCLMVWPDRRGSSGKLVHGHVGVVVEVSPDLLGVPQPVGIVHCSRGNERVHRTAIYRTGVEIFCKAGAIVCALRLPVIP